MKNKTYASCYSVAGYHYDGADGPVFGEEAGGVAAGKGYCEHANIFNYSN